MEWLLTDNQRSSVVEYHLINNNECVLVLKYSPLQKSVRINCDSHQRLFFIENSGSLHGKVSFKNEYGTEMGILTHDKWHSNEGNIIIDEKKYHYKLNNTPSAELIIYSDHPGKEQINCKLKTQKDHSNKDSLLNNSHLLLGLCWYLRSHSIHGFEKNYAM